MFAMTAARIAELSQPDYARDLREYARLEFPHEDLHLLHQIAVEAAKESEGVPRRRFHLFGSRPKTGQVASAKA
jgi:hypothetical protein